MKGMARVAFAALAVCIAPAHAEEVDSYFDLFITPLAETEIAGFDGDGQGYGLKGAVSLTEMLYAHGEFESTRQDFGTAIGNIDFDSQRLGAGLVYPLGIPMLESVHAEVEYVALNVDGDKEEGYGVHLGATGNVMDALAVYASVGMLNVGVLGDGLEYVIGASGNLSPQFGWFVDYRMADLEDTFTYEATEARVGLRIQLGSSGSLFGGEESAAPAKKKN